MKKEIGEIFFDEVQGRTSRQTISFFRILSIIFLVALCINLLIEKGTVTTLTYFLITVLPILIVVNIILPFTLTTQIRSDGIYVRFPPFQPSFAKFYWRDISEVYIRNYNALTEYYGWGWLEAVHPADRASVTAAWRAHRNARGFKCRYRESRHELRHGSGFHVPGSGFVFGVLVLCSWFGVQGSGLSVTARNTEPRTANLEPRTGTLNPEP